jgi:hypothetical protein
VAIAKYAQFVSKHRQNATCHSGGRKPKREEMKEGFLLLFAECGAV